MEEHAADVRADERKPQFDVVEEESIAAERKAGGLEAGPPATSGAPVSRGPA